MEKDHRKQKGMQVSPGPYSFGLSGSPNLSPTSTKHPSLYQAQAHSNEHVRIQLVQLPEALHHHRSLSPSVVSMDLQLQTRNAHSRLDSVRCSEKNNGHLNVNSIHVLPKFFYIADEILTIVLLFFILSRTGRTYNSAKGSDLPMMSLFVNSFA